MAWPDPVGVSYLRHGRALVKGPGQGRALETMRRGIRSNDYSLASCGSGDRRSEEGTTCPGWLGEGTSEVQRLVIAREILQLT